MFEKNKDLIIAVVVTALIAGSGGYVAGQKSTQSSTLRGAPNGFTQGGQFGQGMGGSGTRTRNAGAGFISGQIIGKDATSITVETRGAQAGQASSKTVFLSGSTEVMKTITGTQNDLSIGQEISTNGSINPDGSITAKSIQIRPATTTANVGGGRGMMPITQ